MTNEEAINLLCFSDWIQCLKMPKADLERISEAMSIVGKICTNQSAHIDEDVEARAEKAEREKDAAVSDLETIMAYGEADLDTCGFCKNGQCYTRGGTKPCLPKWRGQKEE